MQQTMQCCDPWLPNLHIWAYVSKLSITSNKISCLISFWVFMFQVYCWTYSRPEYSCNTTRWTLSNNQSIAKQSELPEIYLIIAITTRYKSHSETLMIVKCLRGRFCNSYTTNCNRENSLSLGKKNIALCSVVKGR
jgi:hypothetical protein